MSVQPKIVIVGAGLAGLSVAYKLIQSGQRNVIILEARQTIGGRVDSHNFEDGTRVDMGAQWLHGEKENPIYSWLQSMDLIEGLEEEEVELEGLFRTQTGCEPPNLVVSRVLEVLMDARHVLYNLSGTMDIRCRPVDLYRKQVQLHSQTCPILKSADQNLIDSVLRWFELYEMIDNSCESLSLLSIKAFSNWTDYDDGKMVRLMGGWQNVVTKLTEFIGLDKIKTNCSVHKLNYSSGKGVRVHHSGGVMDCDHVIVTCSIGVLKNLPRDFFDPPLEVNRKDSFDRIGFGVINKIFLQFDRPYLREEKGLKMLWMPERNSSESRYKLPEWTKYMTGFDLIAGAPNVLVAWLGGEGAKEMESYGEQEIGTICLQLLRTFLPDRPAPKLISVKRSTWATDTHIRGAYSYESIASLDACGVANLWAPLCWPSSELSTDRQVPRIQFAGEATAGPMYATAHGAIVSGWREADALIDYLRTQG